MTNLKQKLTSKKILIPAIAVVAVVGAGGAATAAVVGDDELSGSDFDRASAAALDHVGEGKVTAAETSDRDDRDDRGDRDEAYEIEVTRADGTEVDVELDDSFAVIGTDDAHDDDRDDRDDDARDDDRDDARDDADERRLTDAEADRAVQAARQAVPNGWVSDVEASDDRVAGRTAAYEVELDGARDQEWTVWLDDSFDVIGQDRD